MMTETEVLFLQICFKLEVITLCHKINEEQCQRKINLHWLIPQIVKRIIFLQIQIRFFLEKSQSIASISYFTVSIQHFFYRSLFMQKNYLGILLLK
ncbi:unnamed protein product [Paramecium sonneborni]|uniref:Uncharacterized protein n=1 Tax=Paramecium sonneborni TaxID=65129 RepID=A0A8S1QSD5_9CILI|nr:unnamed protein product [Paramecium sonneborni]